MCGIVGIFGDTRIKGFNLTQQDVFDEMLVCDGIRGMDSTGVFFVNKAGNVDYLKLASHPLNLMKSREYQTLKSNAWNQGRIMVGHNRKASVGGINNANAHPFVFGPIALVHNGNIENFRSLLPMKERDKHKVEVDSHSLAVLFARNDPVDIIPELKGAFTIVWYHAKEKKLNIIRNIERPLSMVHHDNNLYFASEKGMLRWLLRRRGINAEIQELKTGCLLTLALNGDSENKHIKLYEPPISSFQQPTYHKPVTVPTPERAVRAANTDIRDIPEEDSYNIHYGNDESIGTLDKIAHPQIVFTVDDFKPISETHVEPTIWRMWGPALDSDHIQVIAQYRGSEEDAETLGCEPHLIGQIGRFVWEDKVQKVYVHNPRPVKLVKTENGLMITEDHLRYLNEKKNCTCGGIPIADIKGEDGTYIRNQFETGFACVWCVSGTPECKKFCGDKFGKCEYCVKDKEEREKQHAKAQAAHKAG